MNLHIIAFDMAKIATNVTIDEDVISKVEKLRITELNGNEISKSLMVEVLLKEAIAAREKKGKK